MQYITTAGIQGICPPGWHIPDTTEWQVLYTNLGGDTVAGGKLKESGTTHWINPNTGATNESGFTALPGGGRGKSGLFHNLYYHSFFWSSSETSSTGGWSVDLANDSKYLWWNFGGLKKGAQSVRCIKD